MIFTNPITLILALAPATLFAAPTQTLDSIANVISKRGLSSAVIQSLSDPKCDILAATMPVAPTPLPSPGAGYKLSHIALGRGTQNYTCKGVAATEKPTVQGAVATLFNATCSAVRAPAVLADATITALSYPIPKSGVADTMLSGHHEFTEKNAPLFKLQTAAHDFGYVISKKNASSDAPTNASKGPNGLGSVPWLKLDATEGDYKEIYRLYTAGGVAPKTCAGITGDFTVEYAALYYFWK